MRSALSPIHADAVDVQDLWILATRIGVKPKFSAAIGLPFPHGIARPNGNLVDSEVPLLGLAILDTDFSCGPCQEDRSAYSVT
jgi:hypothetical protein